MKKYLFVMAVILCTLTFARADIKPGKYTIVTFGDSTTAIRSTINNVYAANLRNKLPLAAITGTIINSGIGGSHTATLADNNRHKRAHALDRYKKAVLNHNPNIIIMQFGINDSYLDRGIASVTDGVITGDPSRIPYDSTDPRCLGYKNNYKSNLTFMVQQFKALATKPIIVLMPPNQMGSSKEQWRNDVLSVYARKMREVAAAENTLLVDVWNIFGDYDTIPGQSKDDLLLDGVHPNDAGHRLIADAIINTLGIQVPSFQERTLFVAGQAGIAQYRIPSLLSTPDGTSIAMVDARKDRAGDIPNNVDIAIRRSTDNGKTWTKVQIIVDYGPKPKGYNVHWGAADAAMVYDTQTKTIWCLYTMGQGVGIRQSQPGLDGHTCQIHAIYSKDEGVTWSKPRDISPQCKRPDMKFFGTAPGVGIQTRDGKLVFCIYVTEEGKKPMLPYLIVSGDHGKTWKLSNTWSDKKTSVTETQIVELSDGTWLANSRNHYGKGRRLISTTKDCGKTWSDYTFDDTLLCPTCMASLISVHDPRFPDQPDRKLLAFANPASVKGRKQGTVRISDDGGKSWKWSKLIKPGEYGYSCLAQMKDGSLGLFYEVEGGELRFRQMTIEWLTNGEIAAAKSIAENDYPAKPLLPPPGEVYDLSFKGKYDPAHIEPVWIRQSPMNEATVQIFENGDIKIYHAPNRYSEKVMSTLSKDGGLTWADSVLEFQAKGITQYPRRTLIDKNGDVHILVFRGKNLDVWHGKTTDGVWGALNKVTDGRIGAIRAFIQTRSGRLIYAYHRRLRPRKPPFGSSSISFAYSDDNGRTWTESGDFIKAPCRKDFNGNNYGAVEPTIIELDDGRLWMLCRTQTGFQYQAFSEDQGETWTDGTPSIFYSSNSPADLLSLPDRRILLTWNNTNETGIKTFGRMYTHREVIHAAISDDQGKTWRGFREVYRLPDRNDQTKLGGGDSGTAYPNAALTKEGKIIVATGQGETGMRAVLLFDPAWLYETQMYDDFSNGLEKWTCYTFTKLGSKSSRTLGPKLVDTPDAKGKKTLHIRKHYKDHFGDGAVRNFPMARKGYVEVKLKINPQSKGTVISLTDHHRHPNDPDGENTAMFVVKTDDLNLSPGKWHLLKLHWEIDSRICKISIDGKKSLDLKIKNLTDTGISYIRFRSLAEKGDTDNAGMLVDYVKSYSEDPFSTPTYN